MGIEWPPFPPDCEALGHPATEEDIASGRAAFVLRDADGRLVGTPVKMGMPRLGFCSQEEERRLGTAVQVEATAGQIIVGVRHADGTFSICSAKEFDSTPRFLILYRKSRGGLEHVERALQNNKGRHLSVARRENVLAVRWEDGPPLFVRHATGHVVRQEVCLIGEDNPYARELAACDALLEVSFLDLDEVLGESDTLCEVQWALEEAVGGFLYLEWNSHLEAFDQT